MTSEEAGNVSDDDIKSRANNMSNRSSPNAPHIGGSSSPKSPKRGMFDSEEINIEKGGTANKIQAADQEDHDNVQKAQVNF